MNPFAQLIDVLVGLYIMVVLLRFFLQYFRADFYNPLSQFVIKATDPLVKPLRKIIPGLGGIDLSTLILAYLIILAKFYLLLAISGQLSSNIIFIVFLAVVELMESILGLFMYMIFIRIILSWISPGGHNPMLAVIGQISEPVISMFRRILPPMSGFDFAPMLALIMIYFLQNSLNYYIKPIIYQLA